MKDGRYSYIDFIRAVSIIVIIVTHTLSYHLHDKLVFLVWNYLHFVVVTLVFSSGYVLTFKYKDYFTNFAKAISWYKKRLARLLLPFYYYLIAHYSLWFLFPELISGLGLKKDANFILQSVVLTGGVDFNWFALLFVQLTILYPLIVQILKKNFLSWFFLPISIAATVIFTFVGIQGGNYRFIMWFSWTGIIYFSIFVNTEEQRDKNEINTVLRYLKIGILSFILFLILLNFVPLGRNLVLTQHKYPPDLIYLTYGIAVTCLLLIVSRSRMIHQGVMPKIYRYISDRTYQLFFIHYLALDFTLKATNKLDFWSKPEVQTVLTIFFSLVIAFLIDVCKKINVTKQILFVTVFIVFGFVFNWGKNNLWNECRIGERSPVAKSSILEWLQKPAAVRFVGGHDRTYISWIEHSGKIQIRFYDHKDRTFSDIYTADDLYPDYGIEAQDDHNAPNLLILPDGRMLLFYAVHDVNNAFFLKASKSREDITEWSERINIADSDGKTLYNYPQAKLLANGNIILFYRRGVYFNSDEYYKISHDQAKTWGAPVNLIDFKDEGIYAFVYAKGNTIHLAWNKAVTDPPKKNVYHIFSPDGGISWKKIDGFNLDLPISEDKEYLVFDSGQDPAYVWDIVADSNNFPSIVYSYKDDPGHELRYIRWNGRDWTNSLISKSSLHYDSGHFFSAGVVIDPNNVFKVYLSKKRAKLEIEGWGSRDQGRTWQKAESITENSPVDNFRPQVVQNYSKELRLVWSSGEYKGLVNSQWSGFSQVNVQSEVTKDAIASEKCKFYRENDLFVKFDKYFNIK